MRRMKPISLNEMIVVALIGALSMITKPYVRSLFAPVSGALGIPTGVLAGTVYMFWLALANHLVNKMGAVLKLCVIQGLLAIALGMTGRSGALTFLTYVVPGLAMEALFIGMSIWWRYCRCNPICSALGTGVANVVGAMMSARLVMGTPIPVMLLTLPPSFLSGGAGGVLGYVVGRRIERALRALGTGVSHETAG